MRRFFAVFLLLLILCGCSRKSSDNDSVTFYYLQKDYTYGQSGSILAPEYRDQSGARRDLSYLLSLYLVGPIEEEHRTPLPAGTRIVCNIEADGSVHLTLSDAANTLSSPDFSLACACLAMTCFDLSDTHEVTIVNGDRQLTLFPDSFLFTDDITSYSNTEEQQ